MRLMSINIVKISNYKLLNRYNGTSYSWHKGNYLERCFCDVIVISFQTEDVVSEINDSYNALSKSGDECTQRQGISVIRIIELLLKLEFYALDSSQYSSYDGFEMEKMRIKPFFNEMESPMQFKNVMIK